MSEADLLQRIQIIAKEESVFQRQSRIYSLVQDIRRATMMHLLDKMRRDITANGFITDFEFEETYYKKTEKLIKEL